MRLFRATKKRERENGTGPASKLSDEERFKDTVRRFDEGIRTYESRLMAARQEGVAKGLVEGIIEWLKESGVKKLSEDGIEAMKAFILKELGKREIYNSYIREDAIEYFDKWLATL